MNPKISPFKFLDSYNQADGDIFFGREKETNDLYQALSGVKHLLVYGPSGAGKTSLVECGLRNQFSDADWYALTIRRGADMTASVFSEINKALRAPIPLDPDTKRPTDPGTDFGQVIEDLFSERYQPVYLLFDQFEELLISGSEDEKKDFFTRLNQLIRYKVPCRVMLIMREEFIGHLSEFEPLCPSIFQHRFRVEKMRKENVKAVIRDTLDAPHFQQDFRVDDSERLADRILSKLPDKSREIELAHVQVFLSELWDRAAQAKTGAELPRLEEALIRADDNLAGVLESFLKKQLQELDKTYGDKGPLETLAAMISERHTKLQVGADDLQKDLADKGVRLQRPLEELLLDLERRRILRTLKSGEQTQYEISHDVLALVVGKNLTNEMEMRARAADIYRVYEERKGFFSQEDLDLIRPYQQYKAYPPALEQRIQASEAHLHAEALRIQQEKEAQLAEAQRQAEQERALRAESEKQRAIAQENAARARTRTRLALLALVVALALAVVAGWSYVQAEQQKGLAETKTKETAAALKKVEQEKAATEAQRGIAETQRGIAETKTREAEANLQLADANLKKAQAEEARARAALAQVEKEKAATEEQRQAAQTNYELAQEKTREAEKNAEEARKAFEKQQAALEDVVRLILQNADRDILNLRYEDALEKIKGAASLEALKPAVAKHYLEIAFWHGETGNLARAAQLLDMIASYTQNAAVAAGIRSLPSDTAAARNRLRDAMKMVDAGYFDSLYTKKYYPDMVTIPGGKFMMGCDKSKDPDCGDDETPHEQEVRSFQIARTETTVWQFALYCAAENRDISEFLESSWSDPGDNPAVNVSWYDAAEYANWVSRQKALAEYYAIDKSLQDTLNTSEYDDLKWMVRPLSTDGYRLPTEAEWEYAARVGTDWKFAGCNTAEELGDYAWYDENSGGRTRGVGLKKPNPFGLYDMSGNVWEWCWDWYGDYPANPAKDYAGPEEGSGRVVRGGSWGGDALYCRASNRSNGTPGNRNILVGFRLASAPQ